VEGLVTSDEEVCMLMLNREAWRVRLKLIVKVNKQLDTCKREESKMIRRDKTTLLLFS
jgi:hypothetical protein